MMKSFIGSIWVGLLSVAHAAPPLASVYNFNGISYHTSTSSGSDVVSPETARLILAQRLGLSQYHSLREADEATLHSLNAYGGTRQRLFEDGPGGSGLGRVLVMVEAVERPESTQLRST